VYSAYAKINIGLFVERKRPDGYHDLLTVFHRVDLSDTIQFHSADDISVDSDDPAAPGDESNLCHRAAATLHARTGGRAGVRITLRKHIPVGAGLGGGSADAAAVLRHLPGYWGISVSEQELREIALGLGSDVPYFLGRGSALARGRGELLEYFDLQIPYTILLCNPGIHVATGWAYSQLRPRPAPTGDLRTALMEGLKEPEKLTAFLRNDFEAPVFAAYPAIADLKATILSRGAVYASMSGSGSSVFGFFRSPEAATGLAADLRGQGQTVSLTSPGFAP
jgi:4-diphosphocytidyl-2-C-methyl-D-erythritol kinase